MLILGIAVLGSFLLSLAGKLLADALLTERVAVLGSFAGLRYSLNTGVAFGVNLGSPFQEILIAIAVVLLGWAAWKTKSPFGRAGFGMILGGALGNIADRMMDGAVTDFFQVGTFPIFNVADSFITIGVAVAFLDAVLEAKKRKKLEVRHQK